MTGCEKVGGASSVQEQVMAGVFANQSKHYALTRLRLRPTRRVGTVARRRSLVKAFSGRGGHRFSAQAQTENTCGYCGSDRRFMTSSGKTRLSGTDDRSKRLQEAKPHDRSQGNDSTERGRYCQRSCEAFGRRDRPDVPQRLCAAAATRTRSCMVFPRASRTAAAIGGADEADKPGLCVGVGRLRGTA